MPRWKFLTTHARVFLAVVDNNDATIAELSGSTGLSERSVISILNDLVKGGYISKEKRGRQNRYVIGPPLSRTCTCMLRDAIEHKGG